MGFVANYGSRERSSKNGSSVFFYLEHHKLRCYNDSSLDSFHAELIIDESMQIYDVPDGAEEQNYAFFLVGKNSAGAEEVFLLAANSEREKQEWVEALVDGVHDGFKQIFQPDLWPTPFYPFVELFLQFSCGGVSSGVENGNILRPFNTEMAPTISIKGIKPDDRYSFVMFDIDPIPSADNANNKYFLHWGVVNFTGGDISTGDELAPYVAPAPVYNSGLHRFFFLLFKQAKPLTSMQLSETVEYFNQRDGFAFVNWIRRMSITTSPAAINGFYAGWEEYCDIIHEKNGYVPPVQYRSPTQETRIQREEDRRRIEQTKLALYKDLGLRDIFGLSEDDPKLLSSPTLECAGMRIVYTEESNIVPIDGAVLTASGTNSAPDVTFEQLSMGNDFYTLIMTDPDAPSRLKPDFREFVHWVVMNIDGSTGGDLSSGYSILPYLGPAPPYSSGLHRYVFTLYKQKDKIAQKDLDVAKSFFEPRGGLRTYQYIRNQSDKFFAHPIAMDAFLCEWDQMVDDFHEAMSWLPPDPFRSPKQKLQAMQSDLASLHDLEREKEMLKERQDAWEQEQYEKLKAAEQLYKNRAQDIEILALTAAVRATEAEQTSETDILRAASSNEDDLGENGPGINVAGSSNKSLVAHKKPMSFHHTAIAASSAVDDDKGLDAFLQQNAKSIDRDVVDKAAAAGTVIVEDIVQTTEVEETRKESVQETSEITRTIEARGGGTTKSIMDKIDRELAQQEARAEEEHVEQLRQMKIQQEIEAKNQEVLRQDRLKEEADAAERDRLRREQWEKEKAEEEAVRREETRVANERAKAERLRREQEERERAEKERLEKEKAEAERLQRIVEEQKRIIEIQQQQQQLLIQQQQLFLQQQQQQAELLQRSNSNSRRNGQLSPSISVDQSDGDSVDSPQLGVQTHLHLQQQQSPPPYVYSSPSTGSGKRVGFSSDTPPQRGHGRGSLLTHSHSGDSDDNASNNSHGSRHTGSVGSNNSRSGGSRPAVGIQRSPSIHLGNSSNSSNNSNAMGMAGNNIGNQPYVPGPPMGSPVGTRLPMSPQAAHIPYNAVNGTHQQNSNLVHHDDLDGMLQPGKSSVLNHDFDDDATITSMGSLIPPSRRSVSPPPSRPTSAAQPFSPVPAPHAAGSPSWQNSKRNSQQTGSALPPAAQNNANFNNNNNSSNNSTNNSQPGTPSGAAALLRKVSLFRPQSQYIKEQQGPSGAPLDESDNQSATSSYTAGGTPIMPGSSPYLHPSSTPSATTSSGKALLKQTTSMYLKSGAGTTNTVSAQSSVTAACGLTADEVKERLMDNNTPTTEKCVIYNISSPTVFDGENVKKKFSKDFLAKDSFMWIDPLRKSLHWGKSSADKSNPSSTKFINLDRVNAMDSQPMHLRPQGEIKGLFKSLEISGTSLTVACENGDTLSMKFSDGNPPAAKRAADWAKMIRTFAS
jgi:phosphatidylethanolamine-binding protein (PEBP) family uncharacterized protein